MKLVMPKEYTPGLFTNIAVTVYYDAMCLYYVHLSLSSTTESKRSTLEGGKPGYYWVKYSLKKKEWK